MGGRNSVRYPEDKNMTQRLQGQPSYFGRVRERKKATDLFITGLCHCFAVTRDDGWGTFLWRVHLPWYKVTQEGTTGCHGKTHTATNAVSERQMEC